MNTGIVEVPVTGMLVAALVVVAVCALVERSVRGEGLHTLVAAVRMSAQLVAVGFVLTWVFDHPSWWLTLLILAVMEGFAILTVHGQHRGTWTPRLLVIVAASLAAGSVVALAVFLLGIVQVSPAWDPRYVVPTAGMIIGNSMTAVNLTLRGLRRGLADRRAEVEQALYLGATPARASADVRRSAFAQAITPTTTSMLSMGIVILPGMMTGQILSGVPPLIAVVYQAVIMVGILLSVVLTCAGVLRWGTAAHFDEGARLIPVD